MKLCGSQLYGFMVPLNPQMGGGGGALLKLLGARD